LQTFRREAIMMFRKSRILAAALALVTFGSQVGILVCKSPCLAKRADAAAPSPVSAPADSDHCTGRPSPRSGEGSSIAVSHNACCALRTSGTSALPACDPSSGLISAGLDGVNSGDPAPIVPAPTASRDRAGSPPGGIPIYLRIATLRI
jgi:hypothetical protein